MDSQTEPGGSEGWATRSTPALSAVHDWRSAGASPWERHTLSLREETLHVTFFHKAKVQLALAYLPLKGGSKDQTQVKAEVTTLIFL